MLKPKLDTRLILESGSVVEWIEKPWMVCYVCGVKLVEWILSLSLAFAVYLQLSKEDKTDAI